METLMRSVTLYTLPVTQGSYDAIYNACSDCGVVTIPPRERMAFLLQGIYEFGKKLPTHLGKTFVMTELVVDKIEALGDESQYVLGLFGTCPPMEQMFIEQAKSTSVEQLSDEPNVMVVISYDASEEVDLEKLESKINQYTGGKVMFDQVDTIFTTDEEVMLILDGIPTT
jgi:hypothetical protein